MKISKKNILVPNLGVIIGQNTTCSVECQKNLLQSTKKGKEGGKKGEKKQEKKTKKKRKEKQSKRKEKCITLVTIGQNTICSVWNVKGIFQPRKKKEKETIRIEPKKEKKKRQKKQ
eukprot:Phypoly_transcript_23328.p1 GENE.Phypoly_transcript_23328~~Phypoly_transcript_23328.p1  ORF type:complete len:116 (+),score=37.51 Phypoly_transcript_23328:85-432(+)